MNAPSPSSPPEPEKRARRAAVRQDRLSAAAPPAVIDVLVMHADPGGRSALRKPLEAYGFRVHPVATFGQALLRAAPHAYAAAFVAITAGNVDAQVHALFGHVRRNARARGVDTPACVLLASGWQPVDLVRAELAGCSAALTLPLGPRDIARVLDGHGIAMPCDPRRA